MLSIGKSLTLMKKEYYFSSAVRGRLYRANADLNLPVYLDDDDVSQFIRDVAKRKKTGRQTAVTKLLRDSKEIFQEW